MARLELIVDPAKAKQGFREADQASDRYRRGARQATEETNRVQGSFRRLSSSAASLKGAIAGLGIGVAVTQMSRLTTQSLSATAAISEQADVAGIGAERFQELTKAFSDLGGVQESVTSGALRRFNRRFGLAQEGMGAANNTLERLNINLDQGTGPALEEAIRKLARMEDGANRTAEASQLFGEDAGPRLAAVLAQGSGAIDAQIRKLREQGRVLNDETVQGARDANDVLSEISDTLSTDFNRRIAENADTIESLARGYAFLADKAFLVPEGIVRIGETIGNVAGFLSQGDTGTSRILSDLEETNTQIELLTNRAAALQNQLDQAEEGTRQYDRLKSELEGTRDAIDEARDRQQVLNDQFDAFNDTGDNTRGILKEVNAQLQFLEGYSEDAGDGVEKLTGRVLSSTAQLERFTEQYNRLFTNPVDAQGGNFAGRAEQKGSITTATDVLAGGQEQGNEYLDLLERIDRQAGETGEEISEFSRQAKRNIQDELGDSLRATLEGNFDQIGDSWEDLIYRMATEAAAADIANWLFGEGKGFGGGVIGDAIAALGNSGGSTANGTGSSPAAASGGGNSEYAWLSTLFSAFASFEGGGETRRAPRAGGLDGRGGYMAMVHPDERIIDNRRGDSSNAQQQPPNVEVRNIVTLDPDDIVNVMSSAKGKTAIMNAVQENPDKVPRS